MTGAAAGRTQSKQLGDNAMSSGKVPLPCCAETEEDREVDRKWGDPLQGVLAEPLRDPPEGKATWCHPHFTDGAGEAVSKKWLSLEDPVQLGKGSWLSGQA